MNNRSMLSIGQQHAGRDINIIAGDLNINNNVGDLNINQNSPAEDVLKVIQSIQHKVGELDIEEKGKRKIGNYLDNVISELDDKKSIVENIKQTNEILKDANATGKTLEDIGILIGKTATWLGTTYVNLGWTP